MSLAPKEENHELSCDSQLELKRCAAAAACRCSTCQSNTWSIVAAACVRVERKTLHSVSHRELHRPGWAQLLARNPWLVAVESLTKPSAQPSFRKRSGARPNPGWHSKRATCSSWHKLLQSILASEMENRERRNTGVDDGKLAKCECIRGRELGDFQLLTSKMIRLRIDQMQ